jgi:hypothetical protein
MSHRMGRRRNQQGFSMLAAIGLTLVLSLSTAALVRLTWGISTANGSLAEGHQRLRAADSGMVDVAQRIRAATGDEAAMACPPSATSHTYTETEELADGKLVDVTVSCTGTVTPSNSREVSLVATLAGGATPSGAARLQFLDVIGSLPSPGYGMTICDWRLGQGANATLSDCP